MLLRFVIAHFIVIGTLLHNAGHQPRQCVETAYSTLNTCVSSCLANSGKVRTTVANQKHILHWCLWVKWPSWVFFWVQNSRLKWRNFEGWRSLFQAYMLKHRDGENMKELGLEDLKKNSFKPLFCLSTNPLGIQDMENTASFFFSQSIHTHILGCFLIFNETNLKSCRMLGAY